jgi:hypothetical protein
MALLKDWPCDAGTLDIAVFCPPDQKTWPSVERVNALREACGAREVILLPSEESPRWRRLFQSFFETQPLPLTARRFASRKAREALAANAQPWTHIMIDGTHAGALWLEKNRIRFPENIVVALRAHNEETEFWSQLAEPSRGLKRWVLERECALMNRFQAEVIAGSRLICPVSLADTEKFRKLYPSAHERMKPLAIGFDWPTVTPQAPQALSSPRFLFLGRLDWHPNAEGLSWFLKYVWPEVARLRPELAIDVVGGFASPVLQTLLRETAGVSYHGLVPDVAPFYEATSLSIIPILTGSGTRVKAIESFRYGRSVLTTTRGIEGVPLKSGRDFLLADSAEEWIRILTTLTSDKLAALGTAAFQSGRTHFDRLAVQASLCTALRESSSAR